MAVKERQKRGQNLKSFSTRLPADLYALVSDWGWSNRLSLAAAGTELIRKALAAEMCEPYKPYEREAPTKANPFL